MTPDLHNLEQQIQTLQKQVAALQGCCQQLFANDQALGATMLCSMFCLIGADDNNASMLGTLNVLPSTIAPVTPSTKQTGYAVQRIAGSLGY
jgi:hypothetical protein